MLLIVAAASASALLPASFGNQYAYGEPSHFQNNFMTSLLEGTIHHTSRKLLAASDQSVEAIQSDRRYAILL
jgi:hypothetical protein